MTTKMTSAYEAVYGTSWADATARDQSRWIDAWNSAIKQSVHIVETYRVSVGNSASGELAAEWTMENLREIREEMREMLCADKETK